MEFQSPHFSAYADDFQEIAKQFSLDPEHLTVEFYRPRTQAILIEEIDEQEYKIHINLEENRIISFKRLNADGNGHFEKIKSKYRQYMK